MVAAQRRQRHRRRGKVLPYQAALFLGMVMCFMAYNRISSPGLSDGPHTVSIAGRDLLAVCPAKPMTQESHYPAVGAAFDGDGGLALQIILMLYMFAGLAEICDKYFETSLEAISEALSLSDDVAGATFMAAGSSAPELFTSIMGVFVAKSDVGIGTIVGSAVFNVLIIIGCCALVAPNVALDWWPLTRDCIFYCLTIIVLVVVVFNGEISQVESVLCLIMYVVYVAVMKFNHQLEKRVMRLVDTAHERHVPFEKTVNVICNHVAMQLLIAVVIIANLVTLIVELVDGPSDIMTALNLAFSMIFIAEFFFKLYGMGFFLYWREPANAFDGILVMLILGELALTAGDGGGSSMSNARTLRLFKVFRIFRSLRCLKLLVGSAGAGVIHKAGSLNKRAQVFPASPEDEIDEELEMNKVVDDAEKETMPEAAKAEADVEDPVKGEGDKDGEGGGDDDDDDDDDDGPANPFEVPDSILGKVYWVLTFPLSLLMWLTVPDCKRPMFEKFYFGTFFMSIVWIGLLSFIMVWMAELFGAQIGIPPPIMGLTILAAGTSIPDTIASVNVAKAGKGNMAVSNSIGSNIFDILIGLGVPWFISTVIMDAGAVKIQSESLTVSVMILFVTVALVVLSIHISAWRLTTKIGYFLLFCYALYITQALLSEYTDLIGECASS